MADKYNCTLCKHSVNTDDYEHCLAGIGKVDCLSCKGYCEDNCRRMTAKWLQSEVEE